MKSCGVTIQMKATEQYFLVLLFMIMSPGGSYLLSLWMKSCSVTIHYLSQQYPSTALIVLFWFFFDLMFDMWCLREQNGSHSFFFFSLLATKPAPTSFSYNILLCVITKNIGSNTVELITDFFPCCSDNDLHGSSLQMIGNALNFLVNSWEIISVWISSPGQSGWWLALDDAS